MKKLLIVALCALMSFACLSCKKTYKKQIIYDGKATEYFHWSKTGQNDPWGVCDIDGKTIIPRVYPRSVIFTGHYFLADSLGKKVLFSLEGERLFAAHDIVSVGLKYFWVGVKDNNRQFVYDVTNHKIIGDYEMIKPFACDKQVLFLVKEKEQTSITTRDGSELIKPGYKSLFVLKEKNTEYILAFDGANTYYKYDTKGKMAKKIPAKQWEKEKKKLPKDAIKPLL